MHQRRTTTAALLACGLAVLTGLAAGCGNDPDQSEPSADETPALQTVEPDNPSAAAPSPSVEPGAEETLTIRQSTVGRTLDLSIGVSATSDDDAQLSVAYNDDPDDEKTEGIEGEAGDTFDLDSGYTITIDDINHENDTVEQPGDGTGSVTVTVVAPE